MSAGTEQTAWQKFVSGGGLFNTLAGAGGAALVGNAYNRLGDIGEQANTGAQAIAQKGLEQGEFKPYTVSSGTGNISVNADGTQLNLTPEQQALQQQLGQGAQGFFGQAMQPTAQRENDIFAAIRAMQSPEEERQRLMLEERLQNQGRLGVRTSMFGGTPEQFSMDMAQAEARNQASLMAMQQAQAQQAQQAALGNQFMNSQYLPQAALMQTGQLGFNNAGLQQNAQQFGAGLFGEASMGGLEALLGAGLGQASLIGNLGSGLLTGAVSSSGGWELPSWLGG
jgi:hypothetical protein